MDQASGCLGQLEAPGKFGVADVGFGVADVGFRVQCLRVGFSSFANDVEGFYPESQLKGSLDLVAKVKDKVYPRAGFVDPIFRP